MAQRKVLIKYYPKNFNHELIVKRGRGKDKLMMVRNMLPMSLRCNTCANYLYIGTKFNMRMEICNEEVYLGIKVFRFYFKCTYCYAEITFKTDPKNHDYVVESGGTRNYEAIKDAQHAEKYLKKLKVNEKQQNSMKYLENKSYDSKREMELMQALEDIKNLNKRQAVIDPQDLLKNLIYQQQQEQGFDQQEEAEIEKRYQDLKQQIKQEKLAEQEKKDMHLEGREVNAGECEATNKVTEVILAEEKQPESIKPEWKKILDSSRKVEEGKNKPKSVLANMKKKITKPITASLKQK